MKFRISNSAECVVVMYSDDGEFLALAGLQEDRTWHVATPRGLQLAEWRKLLEKMSDNTSRGHALPATADAAGAG